MPIINLGNDTAVAAASYLIDAGSGFTTYAWSNGPTTQMNTVSVTGTYCVTVTDGTGCSNNDCIFVDFGVGFTELGNDLLSVYPNPTNGKLTINFTNEIKKAEISVLNITGEKVRMISCNSSTTVLDLSDITKGIYFLKINSGDNSQLQKIILQ